MTDQKRENLLNLALAATEVERRRVPELSAAGAEPERHLYFVAYFVAEPAPNNSSKPTPLRGAA